MRIISHRGYWKTDTEKNQISAFERSFSLGFGTETDIRDCQGKLVISHDPPQGNELDFDSFCQLYCNHSDNQSNLPLALNIKSDGLSIRLKESLSKYGINNYFVFDMSVPDTLPYMNNGLNAFTRLSDLEPQPALLTRATGLWVDCFFEDWSDFRSLSTYTAQNKDLCFVSPELHRRPHLPFWKTLSEKLDLQSKQLILCTDFPEEAAKFFSL